MYRTLAEEFHESASHHAEREAVAMLHDGAYQPLTYAELAKRVRSVASSLQADGVSKGDAVAIMLPNCPKWLIADLACAMIGSVVVPIHTTYNEHYVSYILNHSGAAYAFFGQSLYETHAETLSKSSLKRVYLVSDGEPSQNDTRIKNFNDLLDHDAEPRPAALTPDDLHTIVYTSGTTGQPKGVELTHKNIVSNVRAVTAHIPVFATDRFFSFLPLSHILERTAGYYAPLLSGASIYFGRGSKTMIEDIKLAKPTIVISVPRVFERVHEKVIAKFSRTPLLHRFFALGMHASHKRIAGHATALDHLMHGIFELLVYRKVKAALGGRLRFAISGGAALGKHIAEFFESLGVLLLEGYGLTETSPVLSANKPDHYRFGTVGTPLRTVEIKIGESGEILAKGDGVMRGYHHAPDATKEVMGDDGWLHTGDLGSVDADGFLTIIGRLKEMIVLSSGRNIFPVPTEQALEESKYIEQAMVYGADNNRHIAALIVPAFDELHAWCDSHSVTYRLPGVLENSEVLRHYRSEIKRSLSRMQHFEQVEHFKLVPEAFTQENDLLTPTLKLKRGMIINRYNFDGRDKKII
ncbi:MAG: long-chain fatty acid--CoA ligase [Patescibacteria group bacterium]